MVSHEVSLILLLSLFFVSIVESQTVSFLPVGEGGGTYIKCPNGDSILFNFRRIGQWFPPNPFIEYILKTADPDIGSSLKYIIGPALDHARDYEVILGLLDPSPNYADSFEELVIQGKRSDFVGQYDLENDRDLLEILFQDYPSLRYRFVGDVEIFEIHWFCGENSDIEFVLMNSPQTENLPELTYYRRTNARSWSLKIKNYSSKRSLTITQDIESEEELYLHGMMKKHHEKPKTSILKTSHFKPQREVNATALIQEYNASYVVWGMGCPQDPSHWTPSCDLLYEWMQANTRLRAPTEAHSVVCGYRERKMQINDFDLGLYTTTTGADAMSMLQVDLSNREFREIPIQFEGARFSYPCKRKTTVVDGMWEFERMMKDSDFFYDILARQLERTKTEEEELNQDIEFIDIDEDEEFYTEL